VTLFQNGCYWVVARRINKRVMSEYKNNQRLSFMEGSFEMDLEYRSGSGAF
jgi:hypothetical protein